MNDASGRLWISDLATFHVCRNLHRWTTLRTERVTTSLWMSFPVSRAAPPAAPSYATHRQDGSAVTATRSSRTRKVSACHSAQTAQTACQASTIERLPARTECAKRKPPERSWVTTLTHRPGGFRVSHYAVRARPCHPGGLRSHDVPLSSDSVSLIVLGRRRGLRFGNIETVRRDARRQCARADAATRTSAGDASARRMGPRADRVDSSSPSRVGVGVLVDATR